MPGNHPLTLKLKHKRITVLLSVPHDATIEHVQQQLADTLNEAQPQNVSDATDLDLPEGIEIPVPSMETADDSTKDEDQVVEKFEVNSGDIQLALPVDKLNYSKGWNKIEDISSTLEQLGVRDYWTFAYKYNEDEDFEVEVPVDDYE